MFKAFIIDDNKYAAEAVYMLFHWKELDIDKVEIINVPNGLMERILSEKPHVIFIDIEIHDVSGLDIITKCRERNFDALFVIISGHDNFKYAHTAANLGVLYYMLKPLDPSDVDIVTQRLKKALEQRYDNTSSAPAEYNPAVSNELWTKINLYVKENYQTKLHVQDICNHFFISPRTFFNVFKNNTDKTFVEYLTKIRIEKAQELLLTTSETLTKIAENVGIGDYYYFNRVFKKMVGITPLKYRKQGGVLDYAQKNEN